MSNVACREYPVADDRGGKAADKENFPKFLQNLRHALDQSGMPERPGLSITIVSKSNCPHSRS
jgi:GH18 family chitinase